MTTVRALCGALGTPLQFPGVERDAARLVRDGYRPGVNGGVKTGHVAA